MFTRTSRPHPLFRAFGYAWASPYTALGLLAGGASVLAGGRVQRVSGVWEFHGPLIARCLDGLPLKSVMAVTLGHTVVARHQQALESTRDHERVHVRQFERWGPFMGPAYLGCSFVLWVRGRDWYRENPFERQAFGEEKRQAC